MDSHADGVMIDRSPDRVRRLTLNVWHDIDAEDPASEEDGYGFRVCSFSDRHRAFTHPDDVPDGGHRWVLSYAEHGRCQWSLRGEGYQCPFDSVDVAGVLVWMGEASDLPDPDKSARAFLEEYTAWCNGDCYGFTLTDEDGDTVECVGGFVGSDWAREGIREYAGVSDEEWDAIEVTGEASYLFD